MRLVRSTLVLSMLTSSILFAVGLPATEDFTTNSLLDLNNSTAEWSTQEQAVFLAWQNQWGHSLPHAETAGSNIGSETEKSWGLAAGDLDGDGDLDVIAGNFGQTNRVYLNDGTGSFSATGTAVGSEIDNTTSLALADVDGDGDLDLVVGNFGQTNKLYINDGSAGFPASGTDIGTATNDTQALMFGDIDSDGDMDLVMANDSQLNRLFLNDGSGSFSATGIALGSQTHASQSLDLGDVDGDGNLDIVVADYSQNNKLYINTGAGYAAGNGFSGTGIDIGDASENRTTTSIKLGDMDNDGDLDVVAGNVATFENTNIYLNDAAGNFAAVPIGVISDFASAVDQDATSDLHLNDIDKDGDLDIVLINVSRQTKLYFNDGNASFLDKNIRFIGSDQDNSKAGVLADFNNDGNIDLVVNNDLFTNKVYLSHGYGTGGSFPDSSTAGVDAGTEVQKSTSIVIGDIDNDGNLDIIVGNSPQANRYYLNSGSGFSAIGITIGSELDDTQSIALADVDGDGDLDFIAGNVNQTNKLYLNNGSFAGGISPNGYSSTGTDVGSELDPTLSVTFADIDNDGDVDLITGTDGGVQNKLYLNDGNGNFSATGTDVGGETAFQTNVVTTADVDADGDLDIIAGNEGAFNRLYLNDGTGSFPSTAIKIGSELDNTRDIQLGDVDNDGDLDIITMNNNAINRLYLNDGSGGFPNTVTAGIAIGSETNLSRSGSLGDVDGDGDLDLVIGENLSEATLYLNNGSGAFSGAGILVGSETGARTQIVLIDTDSDGDLDIVTTNDSAKSKLYRNDQNNVFATTGTAAGAETDSSQAVAIGDIDSDGDLDILIGNSGQTNKPYFNNGIGGLIASGTAAGSETDTTNSMVLADVDADGDLDLVAGNSGQTNKLYLNNGSGVFSATGTDVGSETDSTTSSLFADVDSDGDLDLIVGNSTQTNKLYLNDGSGVFSATGTDVGSETDTTTSILFGDVDGDGDIDLVVGNNGQTNKLYLNDGSGVFSATGTDIGSETENTTALAFNDIDHDGDLDLAVANNGVTNKLYLNDGSGGFSATGTAVGSETDATTSIAFFDKNTDGNADIMVGNAGQANKLYLSNGSGGFAATGTAIGSETDSTQDIAITDFDSDGTVDLLSINSGETNKVYVRTNYRLNGQTVTSIKVNDAETGISTLRLTATDTTNTATTRNTSIDYYLSNDGGVKWHKVISGTTFGFPAPGDDIRWKAVLHSASPVVTPRLTQILIEQTVNTAPSITGTPATTVVENVAYSFTPGSSDPENDTLSFSIQNMPSWAAFSVTTGALTGTPNNGDIAVYSNIIITVSDTALTDVLPAFSIEVLADFDGDGDPDITDTDDDNDGMPDTWEISFGLNPKDASDAALDTDNDGVSNLEEFQFGLDPTVGDCPSWFCGGSKVWLYDSIINP